MGGGKRSLEPPTEAQIATVMSTAGGWDELVDTERLKVDLKAARGSRRPDFAFSPMVYPIDSDWVIDSLKGRPPAIQLVGTLLPSGNGRPWDAIAAHLAGLGFAEMRFWVLEGNAPAQRFYERRDAIAAGEQDVTIEAVAVREVGYRVVLMAGRPDSIR